MRKLPESISSEGLLVGWSLEPGYRKSIVGFSQNSSEGTHPAAALEPILDTGEGHLITVAPTGSGKGTGCIIPALLRYDGPVIVVDPKGENYAVTAEHRRRMGQEIILLDPFEITSAEERCNFNPLDLVDPQSERFIEDVDTLTSLMSIDYRDSRNGEFWSGMGENLITAAILDVLTMPDSLYATLPVVRELINSSLEDLQERAALWQAQGIPELKRLAALLLNPAVETIGGYLAFAVRQLDFLKGNQMEEHFSGSDLDLNKIYDGSPVTVYLVLPPDKLESHAALLRLWIGTLINIITRRKVQPSKSTLMLIDETAQLGSLPQLKQAITLLRGYGVRVWTFWQDISQLKNLYPWDWETIINNCRIQQYFGATTGFAAKAVSEISGFRNSREVMDLESDEMILNIPGDEPVVVAKPNYLRDPIFKGLFAENPFYRNRNADADLHTRPVFRKTDAPVVRKKKMKLRTEMLLAGQVFLPVHSDNWQILDDAERDLRRKLTGIESPGFHANPHIRIRMCRLPFYKNFDWYEITDEGKKPGEYAYYLMDGNSSMALTGSSGVMYDANDIQLDLNDSNVILYLRFFCSNMCCDNGRFLVLDKADQLEWIIDPDPDYLDDLKKQILPPRIIEKREKNDDLKWIIESEMLYGSSVYTTRISVSRNEGMVELEDDEEITEELPVITDLQRLRYVGWYNTDGKFNGIKPAAED